MSQRAHQDPAPKHTPTSENRRHESPVTGFSPDDCVDVKPTQPTGQPPQQPEATQQQK